MVTASVKVSVAMGDAGASAFGTAPNWAAEMLQEFSLSDGTTANKADIAYMAERTVASNTNDDIDLAGVLSDALGVTVAAAELVTLFIVNKQKDGTVNTTDLTIGAGSNPVVGFLGGTAPTVGPIKPGGVVLLHSSDAAGLGAVTAGTGDILRIANSAGASNTYQIGILARTA